MMLPTSRIWREVSWALQVSGWPARRWCWRSRAATTRARIASEAGAHCLRSASDGGRSTRIRMSIRSSSGPERRRRWRARSACEHWQRVAAEAARARVRRRDEHEARRERHHLLAAHDRHVAVLERLAQRLEAGPRELRTARRGRARRGARASPRRAAADWRRRRDPRRRSCGAARETAAPSRARRRPRRPAIDWIRVTSIASSGPSGGRIDGSRRAIIVLPVPGGPCRNRLWPPAAATSSPGTSPLWPRTSAKSGASSARSGSSSGSPAGSASPHSVATSSSSDVDADHLDAADQRRLAAPARAARRAGAARAGARPRATASAPRTGRTSPVSDSSPMMAHDSIASGSSCADATSSATAQRQVERRARPCAGRPAPG